jgi:glycyl-tRNA synthetase beta chain
VKIVVEGKLRLPLRELLGGDTQLEEFLLDRVRYYFREIRGFQYDEVNAVFANGWDDLIDAEERLEAIREVRPTENFEPVAAGFKRIKNILRQAGTANYSAAIQPGLIEEGAEAALYAATLEAGARLGSLTWREKVQALASMRPYIDQFFDAVMVNAPDLAVRQNRLILLHTMLAQFSAIADFSEIVTSSQSMENK